MAREAATAIIEGAVRLKKITPAKRALFEKTLNLANDDAVLVLDLKDVEQMCDVSQEDAKKVLASGKSAFSRDPENGDDNGGSTAVDGNTDHGLVTDLYAAVLKYSAEHKVDVFSAMESVVRRDPKLGKRFLDYVFDNSQQAA